ncbi:MAG TPA: hypothetical protein VE990_17465 [Acidimicrobiales bacterium]|nr:hypothetical protein [Acidimicrobiales bacterium]
MTVTEATEATAEPATSTKSSEASLIKRLPPPVVTAGLSLVLVGVVLIITQFILPHGTPAAVLFNGLVDGAASALAAAALVLVYRTTRIINFAQLAIGGFGAQVAFELIRYERSIPFVVDLLLALLVSAGIGAVFDLTMRRFTSAPRLLVMAFTVLLAYFVATVGTAAAVNLPFLPPAGERPLGQILGVNALQPFLPFSGLRFRVGHLAVPFGFPQLAVLEIAFVSLVLVGGFLVLTRRGVAIRAATENTERAVLLGISVAGLGTLVWAIAGALSAASSLSAGIAGNAGAAFTFDPTNLLAPLAAASIGRFRSLPRTVLAAIGISVLSDAVGFAEPTHLQSWLFGGLFVVVAVALFLQRRESLRVERASVSWRLVAEPRPIPRELAGLAAVRGTRLVVIAVLLAAIGFYPFLVSTRLVVIGSDVAVFGIVALSLVVLTGWAGQVSLGQYGFVAIGAVVASGLVVHAGIPFWFAVPITVVVVGLIAAAVGLPALRLPGLYLAVVSLAFATAVYFVLFDHSVFGWLLTTNVARPTLFFLNFDDERSMYYLCLLAFVLAVVVCANVRRGRVGRLLIALRDNDADVQAVGIPVVRNKLLAFALSGALAGFAGALVAFVLRGAPQGDFTPTISIQIFVYALLGGISSVTGGLLGAAILEVIFYFLSNNPVLTYLAETVPLILLYFAPSGLLAVVTAVRDSTLRVIAHRRQIVVSAWADQTAEQDEARPVPLSAPLASAGLATLGETGRFKLRSRLFGTETDQADSLTAAPGEPLASGGGA